MFNSYGSTVPGVLVIVNVINIPFIPGTIKYTMYKIHVYILSKVRANTHF